MARYKCGPAQYTHCIECKEAIEPSHRSFRCTACRRRRLRQGPVHLTQLQKDFIIQNDKVMSVRDVARYLGCSCTTVTKVRRAAGIIRRHKEVSEELAEEVVEYYQTHGRAKTREAYPDFGRSIDWLVKRYMTRSRTWRWRDDDMIQLARMAGFIGFMDQLCHIKRPRKTPKAVLIAARWRLVMSTGPQSLHGLTFYMAKRLCRPGAPRTFQHFTTYGSTQVNAAKKPPSKRRSIILWCDMEEWLLPELRPLLLPMVAPLAHFQRWLYQTDRPQDAIAELIRERHGAYRRAEGKKAAA